MWVINTTSNIDDDKSHNGGSLANTVFEFTPYQYGSEYYRYWKYNGREPMTMHTAVAVSGAAVDSFVVTGSAPKILLSAFNMDIGYYVRNPNPEITTGTRALHAMLPFPAYLTHRYNKDGNGIKIYLTDGGHSENLGAYSLVKRLCKTVIIVDAEHDPGYTFEAYRVLKEGIKTDMRAEFSVPEIEKAIQSRVFDSSRPIMQGRISFFPVEVGPGTAKDIDIDVYYVKLSVDPQKIRDYGNPLRDENWYGENINQYFDRYGNEFPQQATSDLSYDKAQFLAYRELGERLITNYLKKDAVERSINQVH